MTTDARINNRQTANWDWDKGQQLRALRLKQHIRSQEKLAELVGVDGKTIGRWERGEYDIRYTNYFVIRRFYHIFGDEFATLLDSLEEGPFYVLGHSGHCFSGAYAVYCVYTVLPDGCHYTAHDAVDLFVKDCIDYMNGDADRVREVNCFE